ncbi:acyltransferase [Alsobacter sp. KACC 23698]|uniref:Acyltransferase n=1 Tax=Alsobacter sp. KACC 23698 TaxID=3149229 RepID=A0AAU7JJC5_9HYPH
MDRSHKLNLELQALRGIAVLMTFFAHAPIAYPKLNMLGRLNLTSGVDIFLVISGFVIAGSLFPQLEPKRATAERVRIVIAFWIRRAYRLLPASLFWALFLVLLAPFNASRSFGPPKLVAQEFVSVLLYSKNIMEIYGLNFSMGPYWSLSLEEQFYLLLPFVVIVVPRLLTAELLVPLILILSSSPTLLGSHYWFFRVGPLLLGILLYRMHQTDYASDFEPVFLRRRWASIAAMALLLFVATVGSSWLKFFPGSMLYITIASGALVFFASYQKKYLWLPRPILAFFVWVGDRSFSLYVSHLPVILSVYEIYYRASGTFLKDAPRAYSFAAMGLSLAIALVVADLSYRWLERPYQLLGRWKAAEYLQARSRVRSHSELA